MPLRYGLIICVLLSFLAAPVRDGEAQGVPDLAERFYRVGDWKRAVLAYEEEVNRNPDPQALKRLAESYYHEDRYEEARKALAAADPGRTDLSMRILDILISGHLEGTEAAVDALTEMLKEDVPKAPVFTALGIMEMRRDFDRALAHFGKAVQLDQRDFWAWFYTGTIYEDREMLKEAMKAYKRALEINPDYAQAVNNLGYCFKEMHFYAYAIEQYQKAIDLLPDKADYYYNIGNAYTLSNMIDEALDAYTTAINLEPTFAKAHYNLGRTYVRKERYKEAIHQFELYLQYANINILREVASEKSVRDEIERIELYMKYYAPEQ